MWALLGPALALAVVVGYGASIVVAFHPHRTEPRPLALRILVAWLHVTQPFARTWGRLRGRTAEPVSEPSPSWSGDRAEWLRELQRELNTGRSKVRPGRPHESFDLRVSVGPLLSSRLRTAVAWKWLPRQRTELRPRPAAWIVLLAGVLLLPVEPLAGGVVCGGLASGLLVESALLRRTVGRAVRSTTAGAEARRAT